MTSMNRGTPLQAVACDLCGSGKDRTFLTLPDMMSGSTDQVYRLARCRVCELIYLNPRPYVWDIGSYYPDDYAPFERRKISASARNWLHQRSVRELRHILAPPNSVLDIGCGTGELLGQIRRGGNQHLTGIEPSPRAAAVAREQHGLNVRTGTLEQARFPDESFDTVLLSHSLEHLPSPRKTMSEIQRVLKPGGAVVIWAPNARSMAASILGRYWMGWDVPRHFYAFTPGSLHRLIETTDLLPGEILHERHAIEWAWGLRLLAKHRLANDRLAEMLALIHPVLAGLLTPIGLFAAAIGRSGRIRMIARKPID